MKQEPTEARNRRAVGIPVLQGREDVNAFTMHPPATVATSRSREPMTPLDPESIVRRPNLRNGRVETWEARSACGLWTYERTEGTGTPWVVEFVPTGQVEQFTSLPAARRWTAQPTALLHLRATARDVIAAAGVRRGAVGPLRDDPADCAARVAEARQQVAAIDALLGEAAAA